MIQGGRTGLDTLEITPAVFLQLREQLAAGKKLPFNENQLLIAFSRYLRDTKGKWTRAEIRDVKDLHKFAKDYVAKHTRILEQKHAKDTQRPVTAQKATAKQKEAEKFLGDRGLKLLDERQIPKSDAANDKSSSLATQRNAEIAADATEIALELLSIARAADPGTAVAAVMLSYALLPNMSSMAIRGTSVLVEKFEQRSKTSQEKDTVLSGLEIITAKISPAHYAEDMSRIQHKEHQNSNANPEHLSRLEKLKGGRDLKSSADKEKVQEYISLFKDNMNSMELAGPAVTDYALAPAQKAAQKSGMVPFLDLSKGPKPPTEDIFKHSSPDKEDKA